MVQCSFPNNWGGESGNASMLAIDSNMYATVNVMAHGNVQHGICPDLLMNHEDINNVAS